MADDVAKKSKTSYDTSEKDVILATLHRMKLQKEKQFEEFRNKHQIENQNLLRLSLESQKGFEQASENTEKCPESQENPRTSVPESSETSSISLVNDSENYESLHEGSVTGHLQRCFDDSSRNLSVNPNKVPSVVEKIPIFSELRNLQFPSKTVNDNEQQSVAYCAINIPPKRPFLKKGTGLLRYMPKPAVRGTKNKVPSKPKIPLKTTHLPQKTLKLKPAIRKTNVPSEHAKHIRFDVPICDNQENENSLSEDNLSPISKFSNVNEQIEYESTASPNSFEHIPDKDSNSEDESNYKSENLNQLKENIELEEFEMLENFAQNSSFNSDSSIVQRILHGDSHKPISAIHKNVCKPPPENIAPVYRKVFKSSSETENFSEKIGLSLSKCHQEAQAKIQLVQKVISDIHPSIESLQKEISRSKQETQKDRDVSERCSTPIENLTLAEEIPSSPLHETDPHADSLNFQCYPTSFGDHLDGAGDGAYQCNCDTCGVDDAPISSPSQENYEYISEEEKSVSEILGDVHENEVLVQKPAIRKAYQELQKEIERYQELNKKLSNSCKEKNEILKKYQKERDDFHKYKETEKQKLEAEIKEKLNEIKRQKDTFTRYQKLRKDHPTRKEREEFNALRQEVEKLQEELKRQKIKYTSDSRKWKSRLDAAEKERDSFKLENIKLEEQCQDLLSSLKARIKKRPEEKAFIGDGEDKTEENAIKTVLMSKDAECQTETFYFSSDISKDLNEVSSESTSTEKTRVAFNCNSPLDRIISEFDIPNQDVNTKIKNYFTNKNPFERVSMSNNIHNRSENGINDTDSGNLSIISVSVETELKEIEHHDRKEKIFPSGEREIIFHNGTRKVISADRKLTKFLFFNGDVKEILSDGREVYRYAKGVIESIFPDGLKTTEFPNGQIQHCYADGKKEIRFPDGVIHHIHPDGSKKIQSVDGNITTLNADGTKTIEFANGQKEIRTATYKRREFPDGSVKIFYKNGKQETRFSDGRIKIKDKEGKIIVDTKYLSTSKERQGNWSNDMSSNPEVFLMYPAFAVNITEKINNSLLDENIISI